ncbi:MAG: RNA 2',3'-cyclic phosphodiesterase [Planctomycetes bacterium]|nr:RNA 2',3'-cyclic phosphodiesterase [Planctomycetota bacterium]
MPRLFVAIDFPEEVNRQLIGLCKGIQKAKWIKPGQIHLTLKFVGEATDDQAELLKLALEEINVPAFDLKLKGTGTFPPPEEHHRPRVLWAAVEAGPELYELQKKTDHATQQAGIKTNQEHFTAHVTLARFRQAPGADLKTWQTRHQNFETQLLRVNEFHLIESTLTPDGAIHAPVQSFPLT